MEFELIGIQLIGTVIILAFGCELVDSSLGMGYGTTLAPVLLLLGYEPTEIVPAVLLSECITGVMAGLFHQEFGNVNLRPGNRDFKVTGMLTSLGVVGVLVAVIVAVNIPSWMVKVYIGILVLGIGLSILKNHKRQVAFSWPRIAGLGFLAAFNKGISGGGYGPVVTGGQVLAGIRGRSAVGIASLAEGITSAVGVTIYLLSGIAFPWHLAPSLLVGAMLSVPLAAYVVSKMPTGRMTLIIGGLSTALGSYTLVRVLM